MNQRSIQHANKIRLPGLRQSELRERKCLSILRLLVARSYADILRGVKHTRRFHHATKTQSSWTQRDIRLWESLLRVSGRVVWIALQRRFLLLIEAEMDRLFRSGNYSARKESSLFSAVLQSEPSPKRPRFMTTSPLAQELLHGGHDWRLLGLGRIPLRDGDDKFVGLLQLIGKTEDQLTSEGKVIGILGMPRSDVDAMLAITGKRAPESRSLADVLEDAMEASTRKTELPTPVSKCVEEFPRVRFTVDEEREADLKDARSKWRNNYEKIR